MHTKLYVGNLLYEVNDEDLRSLFEQYGDVVEAVVVMFRNSKRSKGYGFVTMADAEAAQKATEALHNTDYRGRRIVVSEAKKPANATPLASGGTTEEKQQSSPIRSFFGTIFQNSGKRNE